MSKTPVNTLGLLYELYNNTDLYHNVTYVQCKLINLLNVKRCVQLRQNGPAKETFLTHSIHF